MAIHSLVMALSFTSVAAATITKPNCTDHCGNISIPFPFGTTPECYYSPSFTVKCNETFEPPILYWADSLIKFSDLNFQGHARILYWIARQCYDSSGTMNGISWWMQLAGFFTVNNTANKFIMVACNAQASISGTRINGNKFDTGCTTMCDEMDDLVEGSCSGLGCCQTSIPRMVSSVSINMNSTHNNFSDCTYAFAVEESAFNFSRQDFSNLRNVTELPLVVDWVIDAGTCEQAMNSTDYACKSADSKCEYYENGEGYRCQCMDGYDGNPYLEGDGGCQDIDECVSPNDCMKEAKCENNNGSYTCTCPKGYYGSGRVPDGCTDIDECKNSTLNDCMYSTNCVNTDGDFNCSCPDGYSGNGRGPKSCHKQQNIKNIFIGTAFGITALLLAVASIHLELKRRSDTKMKQKFFLQNGGCLLQENLNRGETSQHVIKIFNSSELQKATNNFHSSMIVGQGGYGTVYKGLLPDDRVVAIKKSKTVDPTETEQFINEVLVLSQINHRNVVRLLGCCLETEAPLLVYEFISNGTLSQHLHNQTKARFLQWDIRLKIAAETASVLSYLHSAASIPIIHRDVKPDNILLDHTFTAKVSDFGASKLVPTDQTQLMTVVQGTLGYLDPEYLQTHQLTEKSDVYSFGVVLVQLITGMKAVGLDKQEEERSLVNFFLSMMKQECLSEILDENIVGNGNMRQMMEVALIAKECLNVKGEERPSMKEVAMELEGLIVEGEYLFGRNNVDVNEEEMEYLLDVEDGLNGGSTSIGCDSIRDHVLLPMSGGR